jgi:hypothetical protein
MSDRNTKVYFEQGGDELVVANGGKITVESGGTVDFEGDLVAVTFDSDYFEVADGEVTLNAATVALLELVAAIPTVDPEVTGQVWNDGGTLVVSAGE